MYCKYSDGTLIQLVQARYARTDPQELMTYHVPLTNDNGAIPLGLDWQTWTINGVITDPMSVRWHDIIWLSLDNVSWRACRYLTVAFPSNMYQQSLYELTVLVSPTLEGTVVRYPSSGYKFGFQSITGISQAGNVSAYPTIHFLAPLFYAPLSNTLIDVSGQAVTFTRTASKVHAGVTYPINTPIFDSGLYLASDVAQDVAAWTPPAATLRTVAMQIKRASLSILDTFSSLDTSRWTVVGGTVVATGGSLVIGQAASTYSSVISSFAIDGSKIGSIIFSGACLPRETAGSNYLGTSNAFFGSTYSDNGNIWAGGVDTGIAAGPTLREFKINFLGNGTADFYIDGVLKAAGVGIPASQTIALRTYVGGTYIRVDQIQVTGFQTLPTILYVWTSTHNNLVIDNVNNLLQLDDGIEPEPVRLALPASYLTGTALDVVVIDDISHAVTIAVHPAGGSWTSATGTLAALTWPQLTLGPLEGSIANLVEYPYVLTAAEYQALMIRTNLVANGEFETDTARWTGVSATITRTTTLPLVGAGSLKILATGSNACAYPWVSTIIGHQYLITCRAKSTAAAGRLCQLSRGGGNDIMGPSVNCSTETTLTYVFTAIATSHALVVRILDSIANEYLLVDSFVCYDLSSPPSAYSSLSLLFNTLYVGNRYAGEIVKGSDKRLVNANGSDISALLGGSDIAIGATPVTIAQSQGMAARWYVELQRTDV